MQRGSHAQRLSLDDARLSGRAHTHQLQFQQIPRFPTTEDLDVHQDPNRKQNDQHHPNANSVETMLIEEAKYHGGQEPPFKNNFFCQTPSFIAPF